MDNNLEERIEYLEKENELLRNWQQSTNQLISKMIDALNEQIKKQDYYEEKSLMLQYDMAVCKGRISSLPYDLTDPELKLAVCRPKVLSTNNTIECLVSEHKSMARFGDGEFGIISGVQRWRFQDANRSLGKRLREVLESGNGDFLVAINPNFYRNNIGRSDEDAMGIMAYMTDEVRKQHAELLHEDRIYADALCFRNAKTMEDFQNIKRLWDDRVCLFIEGENTGLGVGNDLFSNCKEIHRLICPSENAYDRYDEIFEKAKEFDKDALVLIALGPTATVLSFDLFREGFQAVDVGMLDMQYEAVTRNVNITDVQIEEKYCPTDIIYGDRTISPIDDADYLKQIWKRI